MSTLVPFYAPPHCPVQRLSSCRSWTALNPLNSPCFGCSFHFSRLFHFRSAEVALLAVATVASRPMPLYWFDLMSNYRCSHPQWLYEAVDKGERIRTKSNVRSKMISTEKCSPLSERPLRRAFRFSLRMHD